EQLTSRMFAERLLRELIYQPPDDLDFIGALSDEVIERALRTWLAKEDSRIWILPENDDFFEALQQSYKGFYGDRLQLYGNTLQIISNAIADSLVTTRTALDSLRTSMESIGNTVGLGISKIQPVNFIEQLPGFSELVKIYDAFHQAEKTLSENGFGFMSGHWTVPVIASFLDIQDLDLGIRKAVITNKILAHTRTPNFKQNMLDLFRASSVLKKRWTIIDLVMAAHTNRNYVLAIPTLLAQFEGMFTDALILKQLVIRDRGKLYAIDETGAPKLDKNDKRVELHGLHQKVQNSNLEYEHILERLSKDFVSGLIRERNDIMHGSSVSYAKANLSLRLVLGIYLLAIEFDHFEHSDN
ncbi:MAG: hypothetical protein KC708_25420, partial [Anaerolineae bacterium]|nr:hypothetical protein [Anaerolineae bacterium]